VLFRLNPANGAGAASSPVKVDVVGPVSRRVPRHQSNAGLAGEVGGRRSDSRNSRGACVTS